MDAAGKKLAFLVMEFVEGQPLVQILHDEGKLPVDWSLHVLEQSADGLSAAHRAGVVHRDIKPGNLMVRPDGVVKLTDFGIAQARDATPLTRTGMVVGTAQYLSPEQAQGMEVNAASDVYSLGIVAYECLTGGRPFDGTSQVAIALAHINRQPPPLPPEIPPAVRLLVDRALAKDPADRFPDGGAFADAIRRVAAGGTPTPVAVPVGPFTARTQVVGDGFADGRTTVLAAQTGALTGTRALSPTTGAAGPMPALHGPEDDDWLAGDVGPEPAKRRRWAWLLAGLLLLLLLGGGAVLLLDQGDGDDGSRTADPTSTSSASSAPAVGVPIGAASAYIGRDADDVQFELEALGLRVEQEVADEATLAELGTEFDPDDVAAIVPAGTTVDPATTTVVLTVAEGGWTVEEEPVEEEPTRATETQEPTAPTTTTTEAPTTTSSSSSSASSTTTTTPSGTPTTSSSSPSTSLPGSSAPPTTPTPTTPTPTPTAGEDVDPEASGDDDAGAAADGVTG